MIKLYSFGKKLGVADPSPFVLKVDAYLRMAGIEFESIANPNNLSKAPKSKLPFIDDGGKIIADSQFIFDHLKQQYGNNLDGELTTEQQAQVYLLTKSLDENLYFSLVHSRWLSDDTWPIIKNTFFGKLPFPLKYIVPGIVKKGVAKSLKGQGFGRHTNEEILDISKQSFQALSDLLADQAYFFGETPCSFDAAAFGLLAQFILVEYSNPFNDLARSFPNLVNYCKQVEKQYYS